MIMRDLLATHPFLADLPGRDLDRLSYWARKAVLHAGRRVFDEGGRADRFWLIREGEVSLDVRSPTGEVIHLDSLKAGDALGWSWLSPPYRWTFGAVATQPTLVIEFDACGVRELCDGNPKLGYELYRRLMLMVVDRLRTSRMHTSADVADAIAPERAEHQLSTMD